MRYIFTFSELFHSLLNNVFRPPDDVHATLWGTKTLALQVVDGSNTPESESGRKDDKWHTIVSLLWRRTIRVG